MIYQNISQRQWEIWRRSGAVGTMRDAHDRLAKSAIESILYGDQVLDRNTERHLAEYVDRQAHLGLLAVAGSSLNIESIKSYGLRLEDPLQDWSTGRYYIADRLISPLSLYDAARSPVLTEPQRIPVREYFQRLENSFESMANKVFLSGAKGALFVIIDRDKEIKYRTESGYIKSKEFRGKGEDYHTPHKDNLVLDQGGIDNTISALSILTVLSPAEYGQRTYKQMILQVYCP